MICTKIRYPKVTEKRLYKVQKDNVLLFVIHKLFFLLMCSNPITSADRFNLLSENVTPWMTKIHKLGYRTDVHLSLKKEVKMRQMIDNNEISVNNSY